MTAERTPDVVLERLTRLHPKAIDLSLGRIEDLLARLGHPERRLPPVVHVAGTNGKGSVIAFLRAFLEAAGKRVHVYTSPHLVRFNERIRLGGQLIGDGELLRLLEECEAANGETPITFFEITTAAAFLAFARVPADALILETGLGGRLDATNLVDRPLVTAITPVSIDHQQYLGTTIPAIAGEKAGILKRDIPCVLARQTPDAARTIEARAAEVGAPLLREGQDWRAWEEGSRLAFEAAGERTYFPPPGLAGAHQYGNAGQAIACLRAMRGFQVSGDAIARGLAEVRWPARLQRLTRGPLTAMLPDGWELWLDGGHNEGAAEILRDQARRWAEKDKRPLHLIYGMLNTKDPGAFLNVIGPEAASVACLAIPGEKNALPADELVAVARGLGLQARTEESPASAIRTLVKEPGPARVLICGSLYLAGRVLGENG